jgi:TPR repeat protein
MEPMKRSILLLVLGLTMAAQAADETTSTAPEPAAPKTDGETAPAPKPEPPKKTEYDKLPLPQLLAKARANDRLAQFELGSRFNYGRGVPKSADEAINWLRRAALGGQEDAARILAVKYYSGSDFPPDYAEAMRWTRMLAEKGDLQAQIVLGNMYANGEGSPRDLVQAYMWYAIAAVGQKRKSEAAEPAPELVQQAAEARDKLAGLLTQEEEIQAQKLASDWWLNRYTPAKPAPKAGAKSKTAKPKKAPAKAVPKID